jgi:putative transposase
MEPCCTGRGLRLAVRACVLASRSTQYPAWNHAASVFKHFDEPGHAHFLTFSCYRRLPLLSKERTRTWFVRNLQLARVHFDFELWAWVIMPEHVHLLIRPRQPTYRMADILSGIKQPVGLAAINYLKKNALAFLPRLKERRRDRVRYHFWQPGPGIDRNLWETKAIHDIIEYIHWNPVHRGLVSRPEEWRWSSAADWAGSAEVLLRVDRTVPTDVVWEE